MGKPRQRSLSRKKIGATITEFGACFAAFFFCVLIPCLNIFGFLASYALAQATSSKIADTISKNQTPSKLEKILDTMSSKIKDSDSLKAFHLEPASERPLKLELAIEDLKGRERCIEFTSLLSKKCSGDKIIKIDRANNIYRYRLTTSFLVKPVVDLSTVPIIGDLPIVCKTSTINRTIYRSIEHPEFLLK